MTKIGLGLIIISLLLNGCQTAITIEQKKEELKTLKDEALDLQQRISTLEKEISEADPDFIRDNSTLVSTIQPINKKFVHKIEVRGSVESRKNIILSAEAMGRIISINVTEGAAVKKDQKLLQIDATTLKNTIEELKTSLELAKVVYEKQANLWKNNIGTEIQYLETKNKKKSLERRLTTTYSQLDLASIKAPFSGSIDEVFVKEGEMAQPGTPMFRIVSLDDMYIKADISENLIGKLAVNDEVKVAFPSISKEYISTITAIGQVINTKNRTFSIEVKLESNNLVKPNLTAVLELQDYENKEAWVIPTEIIQNDNYGDFVFLVGDGEEKSVAKKFRIERGKTFRGETEILNKFSGNELIINQGFREVSEGVAVKLVNQ